MKQLLGKKVIATHLSDDQSQMWISTNEDIICFSLDADCCSETWFADIVGVDALIGGVVQSVANDDLPDYNVQDGRGRQESDQAYGFTIKTDKGACSFVYRNSSNGYYGGSMNDGIIAHSIPDDAKSITSDYP